MRGQCRKYVSLTKDFTTVVKSVMAEIQRAFQRAKEIGGFAIIGDRAYGFDRKSNTVTHVELPPMKDSWQVVKVYLPNEFSSILIPLPLALSTQWLSQKKLTRKNPHAR